MASAVPSARHSGAQRGARLAAFGALLAFAGVLIVEGLHFAGSGLGPVGWPALGMVLAAALAGLPGLAGGALVLFGYYVANLMEPARFPQFFADPWITVSWATGLAIVTLVVLSLRERRDYETVLRESERRLRVTAERLELALEGSNVALWDTDLATGKVYLSEAWAALLGAPPGETQTTLLELMSLLHPEDLEAVRSASHEILKGARGEYAVEHRVRTLCGEWKWILSRGRVTERSPSGLAQRMVGTNVDITERKRAEETIRHLAQYDVLTGAANRSLFHDRMRGALARSRRRGSLLALVYLDIDHFKPVNDSFGHSAGDAVLKEVAARLRACVRETDTVARLGGDEFVLLLEDLGARTDALQVAEKILVAMSEPLNCEGLALPFSVSMGLSFAANGEMSPDEVLKRADRALYEAKAAGRGRYIVAQ
jgi:diguanylate cyclase (GGDEF)-like protein/PAS domain S-box-containing protein